LSNAFTVYWKSIKHVTDKLACVRVIRKPCIFGYTIWNLYIMKVDQIKNCISYILYIALNLYNLNLPRGNDIAMHYCCVPCKYPGYRSHYPKRCLHLTMNECQRKFPQMWHSRRLPFHSKDNSRGHSNRWLYSFRGSVERPNIAKSRLINYSTFKIHMHIAVFVKMIFIAMCTF